MINFLKSDSHLREERFGEAKCRLGRFIYETHRKEPRKVKGVVFWSWKCHEEMEGGRWWKIIIHRAPPGSGAALNARMPHASIALQNALAYGLFTRKLLYLPHYLPWCLQSLNSRSVLVQILEYRILYRIQWRNISTWIPIHRNDHFWIFPNKPLITLQI